MIVMNDHAEFVDTEPPRPWEMRRSEPTKDTYRTCPMCGAIFANNQARARYCSVACRKKHDNIVQKETRQRARRARLAGVGA